MTLKLFTIILTSAPVLISTLFAAPPPIPEKNLVVHEWGTYTSLQGSNGIALEGLHHEEEIVPDFVYGRDQFSTANNGSGSKPSCGGMRCKRFETALASNTPLAVTQKLETPVLYFYGDTSSRVNVDVGFPGGVISQWYPKASNFSPKVGSLTEIGRAHV